MNLPGVKVEIPVLTEKDIQDVQEFACKNKMDFIAVSFVQTADDVRLVREVLDSAGVHCRTVEHSSTMLKGPCWPC